MRLSGYLFFILAISAGIHAWSIKHEKALKDQVVILTDQNEKLSAQVKNIQWEDANMMQITHQTYTGMVNSLKSKLDSTIKANHIKTEDVISANVVNTNFEANKEVDASVGDAFKLDPVDDRPQFEVPVTYSETCWAIEGKIISFDPSPRFTILKRTAKNSVQLMVLRPRRVLGFLWRKKNYQFKIFSDCGEAAIEGVKFTDQ